jgi:hypothetical protein
MASPGAPGIQLPPCPDPPKARTPLVEPAAARAAYDAHSARFAALEGPAPAAPSEPRGAVSAALELAATVADPAVRARFAVAARRAV